MDVFDEGICRENPQKAECYEIFDENEPAFHAWFFKEGREGFVERLCFKLVKGCSASVLAAATREQQEEKEEEKPVVQEERPQNQVIVSPADELKAIPPGVYERIEEHRQAAAAQHTDTFGEGACVILSIPKTMVTPLIACALVILILGLAFMAAKSFRTGHEEGRLQRPRRRGSYKIIKEL